MGVNSLGMNLAKLTLSTSKQPSEEEIAGRRPRKKQQSYVESKPWILQANSSG
jgi:hypothetical protein